MRKFAATVICTVLALTLGLGEAEARGGRGGGHRSGGHRSHVGASHVKKTKPRKASVLRAASKLGDSLRTDTTTPADKRRASGAKGPSSQSYNGNAPARPDCPPAQAIAKDAMQAATAAATPVGTTACPRVDIPQP